MACQEERRRPLARPRIAVRRRRCRRGSSWDGAVTASAPSEPLRPAGVIVAAPAAMRVWPGEPYPLGATWDGEGVNFALFSEHATRVELCLFDRPDAAR